MLSVSCDSIHSHGAWAEHLGGITFPMLSDWHRKGCVSSLYGVYNQERGYPVRSVFLIDAAGVVRWKKLYPPGQGLPDVQEVLIALDRIP